MEDLSSSTALPFSSFGARLWASILDSILAMLVILPVLTIIYGKEYWLSEQMIMGSTDFLLNWIAPAVVVLSFWLYKQATPGKMAVKARIVDARTGAKPTLRQFVIRYVGYFVSTIPLLLGFFWMLWDAKNQTWHDKLAGTVVVRTGS